jgi:hypothetical protein
MAVPTTTPQCNCGRRGTPHEGRCIYCMEHDQIWRIWQEVKHIMNKANLKTERLDGYGR